MRTLRKIINLSLPVAGIAIVFAGLLVIPSTQVRDQVVVVLIGVLLIQAGVLKVVGTMLPTERTYTELRDEVDSFIGRVRSLNSAAMEVRINADRNTWARFDEVLQSMHDSIEHMGDLAGKRSEETRGTAALRAGSEDQS